MEEIDLDIEKPVPVKLRKQNRFKSARSVTTCIDRIDDSINRLISQIEHAENDVERHNAVIMLLAINQLRVKIRGRGKTLPRSIVGYL